MDPSLVHEAVAGGPLDLPYLQTKGEARIERDFEPSFRLSLAARGAAARHQLDLPLIATIRRRLDAGLQEHGDKDVSATFLTAS